MNCRDFNAKLSLLATGELEEAERIRCEQHMEACPTCQEEFGAAHRLVQTVHRAMAEDLPQAERALGGFEDRILALTHSKQRPDRGAVLKPRSLFYRSAFGVSLALNFCAAMVVLAAFFMPGFHWPSGLRLARSLPAGMPAAAQMQKVFGELETLFGNRLNWVSEAGGEVAMGIINDAGQAPAESGREGPLVALVYWLDSEDGPPTGRFAHPVVILTRSGHDIRHRIDMGQEHSPLEIAVDSFRQTRGRFAIATQVRPSSDGSQAGDSYSALEATVTLQPGRATKLGEVRMGRRLYSAFLAVQVLKGGAGHEENS